MLYQRYDLVARPKPKQIQKLTWVCGRTHTRAIVTDSMATLRGPIPSHMAASGLVLGSDPAHGQNGQEKMKKCKCIFLAPGWLAHRGTMPEF